MLFGKKKEVEQKEGTYSGSSSDNIYSSKLDVDQKSVSDKTIQSKESVNFSSDKKSEKNPRDLLNENSKNHSKEDSNVLSNSTITKESKHLSESEKLSSRNSGVEPTKEDPTHPVFYLEKVVFPSTLPDISEKKTINLRYPLIPPYAYAEIKWDNTEKELVYSVIEPELSNTEKELLKLIQLGLEEMINISFVKLQKSDLVITYLEKSVQSILLEIGSKVSKETYMKIMYYIFRDFVGLNRIEPLLNDKYIEDIECNGFDFPLYIVHRKYENLRTNVVFKDNALKDFVEKVAQKTGRYISYAKPILDGTLPDGSRVNATYTEDITTRGPTFTIRKFTKEPWTPLYLVQNNTGSTKLFAYLWMAIQYKFNIMLIGETASGKTTFLNAIAQFIPPESRICSVEDTRELNLPHINWLPAVTREGFGIPSINGTTTGSVSLFDLLKETFRQNPDYVILGETRGPETSVLFQGMASGHPSLATFHAASTEMLVRRLQTPPINLPGSLIESLDVICSITHIKTQERNCRRVSKLVEMKNVGAGLGELNYNIAFEWDPVNDDLLFKEKSHLFEKITKRTGFTAEQLIDELEIRSIVLDKMIEKHIVNFKEFTSLINLFYKDRNSLFKKLDLPELIKHV